jgi:hypothetical protein
MDYPEDVKEEGERIRTALQNRCLHKWFKESADECLNQGVCVDDIIGSVMNLQVDEDFIKWLYKRIAKKKYGVNSTTKLTTKQVNYCYDEMVKFFASNVNPPIELPPFPSADSVQFISEP